MCSNHLQLDGVTGSSLNVVPISLGGTKSCKFGDLCRQLKDTILFVDEALQKGASDRPDQGHGAVSRLRFVRNLGRALTMKVVLAGTAATAANMIAVAAMSKTAASKPASRAEGAGELAWIECQLLWKPMLEDEVKKVVLPDLASLNELEPRHFLRALISELARGRPYMVHLFGRVLAGQQINNSNDLPGWLEKVGTELQSEKNMSDASKLVYLLGLWLHQGRISPCAVRLKPPDLVRGNYFEPSVVVDLDGDPACGAPWGDMSLASGHLRVKIYCHRTNKADSMMWCASMVGPNLEQREAFCRDFSGIEYSLTACVQQCLVREPLLAVALSTQCDMDKKTFREALSMLFQETSLQLTVHSVDGKLNEHILFALLQLASNCNGLAEERVDLGTFLKNIADYLTDDYDQSFDHGVKELCDKLNKHRGPGQPQVNWNARSGKRNNDFEIKSPTDNWKKHKMPWLVPACSLGAWNETMGRASSLFHGLGIAGLVPGVRNAAFDAEAYSWKMLPEETASVSKPEWVFEFKASSSTYSTGKAIRELNRKRLNRQNEVVSEPETKKGRSESNPHENVQGDEPKDKKRRLPSGQSDNLQDNEPESEMESSDQADNLPCHAILIAVAGGRKTCCEIGYSDDGQYLRVDLIVGLGRKLLKPRTSK